MEEEVMKIEYISQTVLKRSILKPLHTRREEVLFAPSVEEMCTAIQIENQEHVLMTTAMANGNTKNIGVYAIAKAVNDLATRGGNPIGVSIQITLPPHAYESRLKAMMEHMEEMCAKINVQITGARAEVSPAVCQAIVYATAIGETSNRQLWTGNMIRPNQDIVLMGYVGLEGMLRITEEREEELGKRFVGTFIRQIMGYHTDLLALEGIETAREQKVSAMQQIGSGGVLAALWEMAEAAKVGLSVSLPDISIRQETVEICEYYRLNPYQMTSTGAVLMMTNQGEELIQTLEKRGIRAARLGRTTDQKERVILGGTEKRFMDRPQPDELIRWWSDTMEP